MLSSVADPEGVQGVSWTPSDALVFKYGMKMKSKPTPNTYEPPFQKSWIRPWKTVSRGSLLMEIVM